MITGRCKILLLFDASLTSMVSNRSSRYLNSIMSDFTRDSSMNYWLVHQKPSTKNRQITKTWKEYCLHSWYHRRDDICVFIISVHININISCSSLSSPTHYPSNCRLRYRLWFLLSICKAPCVVPRFCREILGVTTNRLKCIKMSWRSWSWSIESESEVI